MMRYSDDDLLAIADRLAMAVARLMRAGDFGFNHAMDHLSAALDEYTWATAAERSKRREEGTPQT